MIFDKPTGDRMKFRDLHLNAIPPHLGNPITNCGAIVSKDGSNKLVGSHFNLKGFESESEIISFLKNDIYAKEGVWDFNNITINPVFIAGRQEKEF